MDLVTPDLGLLFWTTIAFVFLILLLRSFAWKPILKAVKERENSIEDALLSADKAKEEMTALKADNELILKEARMERDNLLKEAKEVKDQIIKEAKEKASEEVAKLMETTKISIQNEKAAAVTEIKNQVVYLSIDIAEKLLKKELGDEKSKQALVDSLIKEINLN